VERTILRLDRISLDGAGSAAEIERAVESAGDRPLIVVAAIFLGADRVIAQAAKDSGRLGAADLRRFDSSLRLLREGHLAVARGFDAPGYALEAASLRIESLIRRIRARLEGPRSSEPADLLAASFADGSRLSATCVALALAACGRPAALPEPEGLGPSYEELARYPSAVLPGDFSVGADGRATFFGRRGPEAVASALASALGAVVLDPAAPDFESEPPRLSLVSSGRFALSPGVA